MSEQDFHVAPIAIEYMLACHVSPAPWSNLGLERWDSPAGKSTRKWLYANDLIDEECNVTARGKAWVEAICSVPLPEDV